MRATLLPVLVMAACRGDDRTAPRDASVVVTPDAGIPTVAVPCLPKHYSFERGVTTLGLDDEQPTVCVDSQCLAVRVSRLEATTAPTKPPAWIQPAEIRQGAACLGDACTPLGPKLTAAVAAAPSSTVTTDRKAVVLGTVAWSVAADRPLTLKPPDVFGPSGAQVARIAVAGPWLVVTWVGAACPQLLNDMLPECGQWSQLSSSSGVSHGDDLKYFAAGPVGQLDDDLFYVASGSVAYFALFDIATGKQRWELPRLTIDFIEVLRRRPGRISILGQAITNYVVYDVTAASDDPPGITQVVTIPFCER